VKKRLKHSLSWRVPAGVHDAQPGQVEPNRQRSKPFKCFLVSRRGLIKLAQEFFMLLFVVGLPRVLERRSWQPSGLVGASEFIPALWSSRISFRWRPT
jgi:hypothetical protein